MKEINLLYEKALYDIEGGRIRPSKSLQDALKLMLDGNEEFKLMDNQKVVFEKIRKTVFKKMLSGKKNVFIIKGGPGTGKSVLAINLLVKLNSAGYVTQYVSKNSAPREVYQVKLKGNYTQKYIGSLFKGSGCFIDSQKDEIDVLLVDEAHRLNEKSGIFKNKGIRGRRPYPAIKVEWRKTGNNSKRYGAYSDSGFKAAY